MDIKDLRFNLADLATANADDFIAICDELLNTHRRLPSDVSPLLGPIVTTKYNDFMNNFHPSLSLVDIFSKKTIQKTEEIPVSIIEQSDEISDMPVINDSAQSAEAWEPKEPDLGALFAPFDSTSQEIYEPHQSDEEEYRVGRGL